MGEATAVLSSGTAVTGATIAGRVDSFWQLPVWQRAVVVGGGMVVLSILLVGLFPNYGVQGVERVKKHALWSLVVGTVVGGLFGTSALVLWVAATTNETAAFIALPFLGALLVLMLVWTAFGFVGLSHLAASRVGRDHLGYAVAGAGLLCAAAVAVPYAGPALAVFAALVGLGAGIRTNPLAGAASERVVPPDRKV
ncbi:hypothetical protein [Haloarchaeobius sp. DFWS5]|uniref:hypothetical protein n=1 Tax=Haloarchaeobius sp. DFWS5 TaxID=3446114 RepID=UPI003EC0AC44